jgi:hypothetical protein
MSFEKRRRLWQSRPNKYSHVFLTFVSLSTQRRTAAMAILCQPTYRSSNVKAASTHLPRKFCLSRLTIRTNTFQSTETPPKTLMSRQLSCPVCSRDKTSRAWIPVVFLAWRRLTIKLPNDNSYLYSYCLHINYHHPINPHFRPPASRRKGSTTIAYIIPI